MSRGIGDVYELGIERLEEDLARLVFGKVAGRVVSTATGGDAALSPATPKADHTTAIR